MSDAIYPSDVVLIQRQKSLKKQNVPCDMIILSGSAVVNEAILTGESQPLVKESIAQRDECEECLNMDGPHKVHLLHSGTEILQYNPGDDVAADLP